jgi:hypothetical protein
MDAALDFGRMMADGIQYTTVCPLCRAQRPLSQEQVETGRAPICDGCGGTMIVHGLKEDRSATGETSAFVRL